MTKKGRVFIAGKWEERHNIRKIMDVFEKSGWEITWDWTAHESKPGFDKCDAAYHDMVGVHECNLFVLIAIKKLNYRGAYGELGAALALDKHVIIVGDSADRCVYAWHPAVERVKSLGDLYARI